MTDSPNDTAPDTDPGSDHQWHKMLEPAELPDGRVTTVHIGHRSYAVTNHNGTFGVLDNRCPHQGGPLGEGSIENGHLRCPWHGYDYDPTTGQPPPPFDDAPACFRTEVRDDGVYAALPDDPPRVRTTSDVVVETMVNWGVDAVFGMVGHSNLGVADAMREAESRGSCATSVSATRGLPPSPPTPTESSPAAPGPASPSPGRVRPIC